MSEIVETHELSVMLAVDETATRQIEELRALLPPSPYRDDPPHITLLRGITYPAGKDIAQVGQECTDILTGLETNLEVSVETVATMGNYLYSATGVVRLANLARLTEYRNQFIFGLLAQGYTIEQQEVENYSPHLTVRLGVPLEGDNLKRAISLFPPGRVVALTGWSLMRLVLENGKRQFQVVTSS